MSLTLFEDAKRIRGDLELMRSAINRGWQPPEETIRRAVDVLPEVFKRKGDRYVLSALDTLVKMMASDTDKLRRALSMRFPITGALMQAGVDVLSDCLDDDRDLETRLEATRILISMSDQNRKREALSIALSMKDDELAAASNPPSQRIVIVEDENWYRNNAHAKAAEAASLPDAGTAKPVEV